MPLEIDGLLLSECSGVLLVTLNRPEHRNALSADVLDGLVRIAEYVEKSQLRAVVLRGVGETFCAGGDLKSFRDVFQGDNPDRAHIAAANRNYGTALAAWDRLPVAVIAAVDGAAMAGGMGLVAIADIAICTASARFALTETKLGLTPAQISPFVVARIGLHHARRLMLTSAVIGAEEAMRLSLIDEVVPDIEALDAAVERTVNQVLRCAPEANALTKELAHAALEMELEDLLDHAALRFADTMVGPEAHEGVASFFGKRDPEWVKTV
ncbi:enoyl-CoA hydratase-related protein [Mycobacterium sp. 1274756.6]|uniref:enoyl-CoA hydratase-related protein n=1 Tax=Mycobacterium sp. 1274756.6 TaxID=1834076 RepID=UPI0018D4D49C|nr:enoyl-CoA hydratase-related protein [Mycobacterium sp. 1274756.6]